MSQKKGFMSSTISEIFRADSEKVERGNRREHSKRLHTEKTELKSVWREVQELAASQLQRPQRRRWKEQQLENLGAKLTHKENRYIPYPMLIGIRRKQREREKQREAEERNAGMTLPKKKKSRRNGDATKDVRDYINKLRGNRRGREPTRVDAPSVGIYHDGTLVISQHDIHRVTGKRHREDSSPPSKRRRRRRALWLQRMFKEIPSFYRQKDQRKSDQNEKQSGALFVLFLDPHNVPTKLPSHYKERTAIQVLIYLIIVNSIGESLTSHDQINKDG
jgi:hypothetical protein